jgi:DNA processing protein
LQRLSVDIRVILRVGWARDGASLREVFGVPGNVTQLVIFRPNSWIKQGAKLVTSAEVVMEELPTPVRAALLKADQPEAEQRNLLVRAFLNPSEKEVYELPSAEESKHLDDIVEQSGLNSSEVLATLFDLEMKGVVWQSPGKQSSKVLLSQHIRRESCAPRPASKA